MDLNDPQLYINRELSWLEFNERVLEEACDTANPVMERLKFLSITASNLDEFFMVRVSSLWEQDSEYAGQDMSGLSPKKQLAAISERVHLMVGSQFNCLTRRILPALAKEGIKFLSYRQLNEEQKNCADEYFFGTVYPTLTPMASDTSRPFPVLTSRAVNMIIELTETDGAKKTEDQTIRYAAVPLPGKPGRIFRLPSDEGMRFIMAEDIIAPHLHSLFPGYKVNRTALFRVTRNSDLEMDADETENLMNVLERSITRRRWGDPVRLEVSRGIHEGSLAYLCGKLGLDLSDVYEVGGPLDLTVWMGFYASDEFAHLRDKPQPPVPAPAFAGASSVFDVIRARDVLAHHPYESFDCVVNFVREAALDPSVLAIKQTLYRVSGNSPVVEALVLAAANGKQVTVLVELKARFDEENNISWAKKLEYAGCHVIYGLVGLKTHCKISLVVRREDDGIRRYIHFGTGNYNDTTAKIYTDISYFTCKEMFGQDGSMLFNVLTGYAKVKDWQKISVAPVSLRSAFIRLIEAEAALAKSGMGGSITAKMNSLSDPGIIRALYSASIAGVKIRLFVRGICCLAAGVRGVSENISVSSIVDRYLEHSRVYWFGGGGNNKLFISSADWMPRNLDTRVEVLVPIEDADLKNRLIELLEANASDNVKSRVMQPDRQYKKTARRGKPELRSQAWFYENALARYAEARQKDEPEIIPRLPNENE